MHNKALCKIDFSIQFQAEALEACINRVKDSSRLGSDLFLEIERDDRERLFKSRVPRSYTDNREKNSKSWIAMTFAGGHRDESRIAIHALMHYVALHRDCIGEARFKDCLMLKFTIVSKRHASS